MKIRYILLLFVLLTGMNAFSQSEDRLLYQSDSFKIFDNRVEQSTYKSVAESAAKLISNYLPPPDSALNPMNMRVKQMETNLSNYPALSSKSKLIDALYRLSLEETTKNIREDRAFISSPKDASVSTRDIGFSSLLSLALIEPETVKNSLLLRVSNKKIVQDTGNMGSWPMATDRQLWVLAAWEVYKTTGNLEWLKQAYEIAANTMKDDLQYSFDASYGLFHGATALQGHPEQLYPKWMQPIDIYHSFGLSTNAIFYQSLTILSQMANRLQIKNSYQEIADKLKNAINKHLWLESKGHYSQFLYGHYTCTASPRCDALGASLCILFNIADRQQACRMMANMPHLEFGIPYSFPQIPGVEPYQNETIWPFIQALWTMAGAKAHVSAVVEHGMACIFRPTALTLSNQQNILAASGHKGNSSSFTEQSLSSASGSLAMVFRLLLGLDPQPEQLTFSPFVPRNYANKIELQAFQYRNAVLDIEVDGYGDAVSSVEMDGIRLERKAILSTTQGRHKVVLKMNNKIEYGSFRLENNATSPDELVLSNNSDQLCWNKQAEARYYLVFLNGKLHKQFTTNSFYYKQDNMKGEYQVLSIDKQQHESYLSKPFFNFPEKEIVQLDLSKPIKGKTIQTPLLSPKGNMSIPFELKAARKGTYIIEFSYMTEQDSSQNTKQCMLGNIICSKKTIGSVVFPPQNKNSSSKLSTHTQVALSKGKNKLELKTGSMPEDSSPNIRLLHISIIPAFNTEQK